MVKHETAFDFLRVTSIILIVFSHILESDDPVVGLFITLLGLIGNGAFFFISGYVIYLNNKKIDTLADVIHFYKKRVIRIFPLYWLALIVSIIVFSGNYSYNFLFIASHFLGIQMIIYPKFISTNISPFWFIGMLLIYYLIYPFLILLKANSAKKILLYSSVIFAGMVLIKLLTGLIGGSVFEYYYIFIAGILFVQLDIFNRISKYGFSFYYYFSPFVVFFILYILAANNLMLNENVTSITFNVVSYVIGIVLLRWVLIFSAILFIYFTFKKFIVGHDRQISLIVLGSISSYAVFLFHKPFFYYFDGILNLSAIHSLLIYNLIQVIIGIPVVFLLCHYITKYFDKLTRHFSNWM
ncbi:MAG: acyltransferase family protein [Methanoregula sp.]